MTGNINSLVASSSDFHLDVSVEKEACPNNLAPTSSTTSALVMGDAIAVSLSMLTTLHQKTLHDLIHLAHSVEDY